jgi:hypothetical protein
MKKKYYYRDRKAIRLTNEFHNQLLDDISEGIRKLILKMKEQKTENHEIIKYLMKEQKLSYMQAVRMIKASSKSPDSDTDSSTNSPKGPKK